MTSAPAQTLLKVADLALKFRAGNRVVHALRGVSFSLAASEILAIVGESGSGKSVTGLSLLRLHGKNAELQGQINLSGEDINAKSEAEMRKIRGRRIAMIFQEPMTALNPVFTVGFQLNEVLALHMGLSPKDARSEAIRLMGKVGIPEPELRLGSYPFQLSGGMRQRVLIAMALAAKPEILIADEPTTALDVTIQSQILRLLREINEREKTSMIFITHDLGIVARLAHRVAVMYAGEIVETGTVAEIFAAPKHPYTRALLASVADVPRGSRLSAIPGSPPQLSEAIHGCAFAPRCSFAEPACRQTIPPRAAEGHEWRCIHE
ncbi:MAG TPA: ABC transporter ATP-binding protein [Turneriella sp.]|nr:ABC transporter ATP-binding protein [Turneriella sp.]